jgi:hypothetical protein
MGQNRFYSGMILEKHLPTIKFRNHENPNFNLDVRIYALGEILFFPNTTLGNDRRA